MDSTKLEFREATTDSLDLLSAFLRALSHKIRTPLSVISNDLTYFQTLVPNEDFSRAIGKVQDISEILRSFSQPIGVTLKLQSLSGAAFSQFLQDNDVAFKSDSKFDSLQIEVDPAGLVASIRLIQSLVDEGQRTPTAQKNQLLWQPTQRDSLGVISTKAHIPLIEKYSLSNGPAEFSDLTTFFFRTLQIDTPTAPLIDLMLGKQAISMLFRVSRLAEFHLRLNLV